MFELPSSLPELQSRQLLPKAKPRQLRWNVARCQAYQTGSRRTEDLSALVCCQRSRRLGGFMRPPATLLDFGAELSP